MSRETAVQVLGAAVALGLILVTVAAIIHMLAE
jgi:hypothetical protein